jgi:hypothetical protein
LAIALRQRCMQVIDLREDLTGIRGTYRLTDGHRTTRGTEIVAARVADALLASRTKLVDSGKQEKGRINRRNKRQTLLVRGSISILRHHFGELPTKGIQFDMTGAILTTAVFALLCSTLATIGNFAIARDFPDFELDPEADFLLDAKLGMRFMQYRLTTNLFYHQSLVLWALLAVLLAYKFLLSF